MNASAPSLYVLQCFVKGCVNLVARLLIEKKEMARNSHNPNLISMVYLAPPWVYSTPSLLEALFSAFFWLGCRGFGARLFPHIRNALCFAGIMLLARTSSPRSLRTLDAHNNPLDANAAAAGEHSQQTDRRPLAVAAPVSAAAAAVRGELRHH